jgi:hypothetical protein
MNPVRTDSYLGFKALIRMMTVILGRQKNVPFGGPCHWRVQVAEPVTADNSFRGLVPEAGPTPKGATSTDARAHA